MGREIIATSLPPHGLEAWHPSLWGFLSGDLQEPTDPQSRVSLHCEIRGVLTGLERMDLHVEMVGKGTGVATHGAPASALPRQLVLPCVGHYEFLASCL